jgi:hypothetical protein
MECKPGQAAKRELRFRSMSLTIEYWTLGQANDFRQKSLI